MAPSFIESGFNTKAEYEAWLASGAASMAGGAVATLGYWKIRGLAAAPRMMFAFKKQAYKNVAYGDDAPAEWFGGDKKAIQAKNTLANLPYVIDGDTVVTQSNSVLVYLGSKLGIDKPEYQIHNHQVLDQTMDLRNDLMTIAYGPAGANFKAALEKHMKGAMGHFKKLEGFCVGPYMCGPAPQCGDFHVFEMFDQHLLMCAEMGVANSLAADYPKLAALHAALKAEPSLAPYFASDAYAAYAVNNPLYTNFKGKGFSGTFGPTTRIDVTFE